MMILLRHTLTLCLADTLFVFNFCCISYANYS